MHLPTLQLIPFADRPRTHLNQRTGHRLSSPITADPRYVTALQALDFASGDAQFRTLAEAIPQIVWTAEPDGELDYYNQRWYDYTGMTPEQTRGWGWKPVIHPEDLDACIARWISAFTRGHPYEVEYRFKRHSDNSYRWHLGRATPLRDDTGSIIKWFGTCTDIDDQKRAVEASAESEERFRSLIHQSPVATVLFDMAGHPIDGNPAFERMWGRAATDIAPDYSVLNDRQLEAAGALPLVHRAFAGDHVTLPLLRFDYSQNAPGGKSKWTQATYYPVRGPGGVIERVVAICEDVTARVEAEAAERDARERFRVIVDASLDGLALFRPIRNGNVVVDFEWRYSNPAGYTLSRASVLIGKTLLTCYPELYGTALFESYVRVLATGIPLREEYSFTGEHGPEWVLVTVLKIGEELAVNYSDITARKRVEEYLATANVELERGVADRTAELTAANVDLARSNADLEAFAYVASHDLQEPLRMVRSYTELLKRRFRAQLGPDGAEFIDFAADGAARMHRLIEDLLAYSRAGSGGFNLQPVDASQIVARAASNLRDAIDDSGVQMTCDVLPTVFADATLLEQLFQNLIGNAVKFRRTNSPAIGVTAARIPEGWQFSVTDNGIGIDPEYSKKVFAMFQRLHTRDEYPGTGIGLALCARIVARHGGHIWVESALGRGSTFNFTLPLQKDTPQ